MKFPFLMIEDTRSFSIGVVQLKHAAKSSWDQTLALIQTQPLCVAEWSDRQGEMEASRCSRKGSKVMKINRAVVWMSFCCSLCGTPAQFLRVSSANVSLLLEVSSCFILMPQWNCDDLHYVRGSRCLAQLFSPQRYPSISPSLSWFIASCCPWDSCVSPHRLQSCSMTLQLLWCLGALTARPSFGV